VDTLTGLDPPVLHRCSELLAFSEYALRRAYNPQGINGGLNLGEAAGAGIAEHVHWHILPRWVGDTSSVTVLGNSRYVPEDLRTTKKKLKPIFEGFTPSK